MKGVYRICCAACDFVIEREEFDVSAPDAEILEQGKEAASRFMLEHVQKLGRPHWVGYAEWVQDGKRLGVMPVTTAPEGYERLLAAPGILHLQGDH